MTTLREYLESHAAILRDVLDRRNEALAYASKEEFILRHGEAFTPRRRRGGYRKMTPKHCFDNSQLLALMHPRELTYVEGYAYGIIPMEHAWCVDRAGRVVDPTWSWGTDYHPIEPDRMIGVRFSAEMIRARRKAGGDDNVALIDAWDLGFPLLQEPYDPDRALARLRKLSASQKAEIA